MRIIQISDTHLSPGKAHFTDNWAPLARWIAEQRPDLVIHTGDVTVDGADVEEDMRYSAELMRGLGVRFRAVPGNHDVGDAGHLHQPVNEERLQRWRTYFGPDRWVEDIEDWRLIGLDALLFSSGEREEKVQADWLETVMNEAAGRHIAWFLHRPLFLESPTKAIPDTGRSNRSREPGYSTWSGVIPLPWSPAVICTRRMISGTTAPVTSGRPRRHFLSVRR